jgi:hypothetical protein
MTYNTGAAARLRLGAISDADNLDRILVAVCAAIWLAVLGSAVAATVALVDLGRGHPDSSSTSGTPWLLYTVIGVSALVIIGAIPLLVRARRAALADPRAGRGAGGVQPTAERSQTPARVPEPQTEKLRSYHPGTDPTGPRSAYPPPPALSTFDAALPPAVDRLWPLRRGVARHGSGARRRRHLHLPDGRGARPTRLDRLRRSRTRHVGDARHPVVLPTPTA